jgi:flagellin-like hook-associated protein FlgL
MSLNAAGTGLQIDDAGGNNLTISDTADNEFTARNLGIAGSVGTQLVGGDLNPLVHFSITEDGGATAASLGLLGDFNRPGPGEDINPLLSVDTLLTDLQNGNGFNAGDIVIWQGERRLELDLDGGAIATVQDLLDAINTSTLQVTASLNAAGTGIQITNDDPDRSLTIEDVGDGSAAKDLGIYGSSDLLGTMLVLANALEKDDVAGVDLLLQSLDNSIQHLLDYRSTVGARTIRIETTSDRLAQKEIAFTESLSQVEDADISELVTQLATMENNYQTALMATAKIVQPSLLDFLS